jgi:hypothetical protein
MLRIVVAFIILISGFNGSPFPGKRVLNPNAIKSLSCTAKNVKLNNHNINVALLSICGGISGKIQKCQGSPKSSTGEFGDSKFTINAVDSDATINVSKGRWEAAVFAARHVCGDSPFDGIVPGGTTRGDLHVVLQHS